MIKMGTRFYDEREGRYLTVDGVGCDPKCYSCIEEEYDFEIEDLTIVNRVLMMEGELLKMMEVE